MVCIEYRANFLINAIFNIVWTAVQIVFISLIFYNISSINGWSKYEIILLFGIDELIFPLFIALAYSSLTRVEEHVLKGTMDYVLTKPINERFYLSLRHIDLFQISPIIFGITIILYAKNKLGISVSFMQIILLIILIFLGVCILYSMYLICVSFAFKFSKSSFLRDIMLSFIGCMIYPLDIYKGIFRIFITVIIPVGIIVDFPARMLVKVLTWDSFGYIVLIALVFGTISNIVWRWGVRNYTSASS